MDATEDLGDIDAKETRRLVRMKNRKSGGFQSMGLSFFVMKGITIKGYKMPTPIQRRVIPIILEGRDVVAMARTGSGKTAAFLVPMFERLQRHSTLGPRALIMSPTRELAMQTLKFTRELGKFSQLKAVIMLGGDKIEDQFSAMHGHPDIIIATPGRFLHVCVEMSLKLSAMEYVVFDEADRLFEMGFAAQLDDILRRLPTNRQTLLFSATLPRLLVDFAKAGLQSPELIRLDVESKLSDKLKTSYFLCRPDDKAALLLHLLSSVLRIQEDKEQQVVIFAAVMRDVEYLFSLLTQAGFGATFVYSSLDPQARKINTDAFRSKKSQLLIVTDLAARGIDIPHLSAVINFNFPAKPKLFLHRVGRVARAGMSGSAYSLVSVDEMAYLLDLHLFLGLSLQLSRNDSTEDESGLLGRAPRHVIEEQCDQIRRLEDANFDLKSLSQKRGASHAKYLRTRPPSSAESTRRAKEVMNAVDLEPHPLLKKESTATSEAVADILSQIRGYKSKMTIFEATTAKSKKSTVGGLHAQAAEVMKATRAAHAPAMEKTKLHQKAPSDWIQAALRRNTPSVCADAVGENEEPSLKKRKVKMSRNVGGNQFVHYCPQDSRSEAGLGISSSFVRESEEATLDLTADDEREQQRQRQVTKRWDKKKKRFIGPADVGGKMGKIKTESGVWIPASFKSDVYAKWLKRNRGVEEARDEVDEPTVGKGKRRGIEVLGTRRKGGRIWHTGGKQKQGPNDARDEIKRPEQIMKEKKRKDRLIQFMKKREAMRKGKKTSGKRK